MNTVGKPTDEEYKLIENAVRELFVSDTWAMCVRCWDDDDVHITAYSTIGTNSDDGYPLHALIHRQEVIYERQSETLVYRNRVEIERPRPDKILDYRELEI